MNVPIVRTSQENDYWHELPEKSGHMHVSHYTRTTVWPSGLVSIRDVDDGQIVTIEREDAIELAKKILITCRIPFCNRVKEGN
jgi:hypothetical protein